jgi:hypothetical protein
VETTVGGAGCDDEPEVGGGEMDQTSRRGPLPGHHHQGTSVVVGAEAVLAAWRRPSGVLPDTDAVGETPKMGE